jgi:hypothetical protein
MFRPLTIAFAVSTLLASGLSGRADPITYDFSGNFDRPMNGTTQFSGSFTFNRDPTTSNFGGIGGSQVIVSGGVAQIVGYSFTPDTYGHPPQIAEYGNDVSLTVNMGGQTIHYVNTPQNPYAATVEASGFTQSTYSSPNTFPPTDVFSVSGVTTQYHPGNSFSDNSFSMDFYSRPDTIFSNLPPGQVAYLGNFNFSNSFHGLDAGSASGGSYTGTITSIEMVSAPESSTLVIFAVLGIAARALRSCRSRSKTC